MKKIFVILVVSSMCISGCITEETSNTSSNNDMSMDMDPCSWFKGRSSDNGSSSHTHSMQMMDGSMGNMTHSNIEIGHNDSMPCVKMTLYKDSMSGYNVHIETVNFTFAPSNVSSDHVMGEGHSHVYVNGTKVARGYGDWVHIPTAGNGSLIKVELNANNHSAYTHHGIQIMDEILIGHHAMHMNNSTNHGMNHTGNMSNSSMHGNVNASQTSPPSVMIEKITVDPKTVNSTSQTHIVEIKVLNFTFTPMNTGMNHVDGEGHAHYYLNGEKLGRLYTTAFDVSGLTPGNHTLLITLNSNNHGNYVIDGEQIHVEVILTVPQ